MNETLFTETEAGRLAELASALMPGRAGLPAAGDVRDLTTWLHRAAAARPELVEGIRGALTATPDLRPEQAVRRLFDRHPPEFEALSTILAGAYLMHPDVRDALGYPGQVPRPVRQDIEEYADMLAAVFDRGPRYRAAP